LQMIIHLGFIQIHTGFLSGTVGWQGTLGRSD